MKYYIAGGAVRDLLLGRTPRDMDYLFTAPEEEFIQGNPQARKAIAVPHPVYILNGSEYSPLAGGSFATDMAQRDFTINALALSSEGILHAHPRCFEDLKRRVIRPASPTALMDDPVRIFRAARLSATLPDFTVHSGCLEAMRAAHPLAAGAAPEQIGREARKACEAAAPGNFPRILAAGGCLSLWFAELEGAHAIPAGPARWHRSSVLEHTARVMDATAALSRTVPFPHDRGLAVWMAFCHDLGKISTPPDMLPRHIGHELRGMGAARALGSRLRLPAQFIEAGALAAKLHMKAGVYPSLRPGTRTDLVMQAHAAHVLEPLFLLAAADSGNPELPGLALRDRDCLLAVTLPLQWQDKGEASGKRLRELRCKALAEAGAH